MKNSLLFLLLDATGFYHGPPRCQFCLADRTPLCYIRARDPSQEGEERLQAYIYIRCADAPTWPSLLWTVLLRDVGGVWCGVVWCGRLSKNLFVPVHATLQPPFHHIMQISYLDRNMTSIVWQQNKQHHWLIRHVSICDVVG